MPWQTSPHVLQVSGAHCCLPLAVRAAIWSVDSVLLPLLAHFRTMGELLKAHPGHGTIFSQTLAATGMTTAVTSSRFNGTVLMPSDKVGGPAGQ
jgi:hypothetical protein